MKTRTGETCHHTRIPSFGKPVIGDSPKRGRSTKDGTVPRKGDAIYASARDYSKSTTTGKSIMGSALPMIDNDDDD